MGRSAGAKNVTPAEKRTIRRLFREGVKFTEIVKRTGRSDSVVTRVTRGMKRKRVKRIVGRHAKRNDRILALVEKGWTRAQVGKRFGLSPTQVGWVIWHHPTVQHLLRVKRVRPAVVAERFRMNVGTARRIAAEAP